MKKYILVSVAEREISTTCFDTLEEAQNEMKEDYENTLDSYGGDDEGELDKMSAWLNADDGDMNCDWKIEEVEC